MAPKGAASPEGTKGAAEGESSDSSDSFWSQLLREMENFMVTVCCIKMQDSQETVRVVGILRRNQKSKDMRGGIFVSSSGAAPRNNDAVGVKLETHFRRNNKMKQCSP